MGELQWDTRTAAVNRRRHGIDFADATAALEDDRALTVQDEIGLVDEPRTLTLGRDALGRVVVVAFARRGRRIRLISARPATSAERRQYRRTGE